MNLRLLIPVVLAASVAGAASVQAATDPASGEVSAASPTTSFSGSITEPSGAVEIAYQEEGTSKGNCHEPACQEYALTVKDPGMQLAIDSVVDEDGFSQTVEVEDPDGKITQTSAVDPGTVKAKIKNPKAGAWLIRIYGSDYINGSPSWTYKATVTLTTAGSTPPATTPPGTSSGGSTAPPPAPTVKASAGRLSAKKLNKKKSLTLRLTASAQVDKLQVALSTGSATKPKTVGRATVSRMNGTRWIKIRFKGRLKPGALRVSMRGVDGSGQPVTGSATLRVKR